MTESEGVGGSPDTDDDEPSAQITTVPTHTTDVTVPVPVPRAVEQEAERRAADLGESLDDALRSQVSVTPRWLLSDDLRECLYVPVTPDLQAAIDDRVTGSGLDRNEWIRDALRKELARVPWNDCSAGMGRTLAGPSGVPDGDQ